jgi:GxxExxY protein
MQKGSSQSNFPYKHSGITEKIIAAFYTVYNCLGYGFLEKVYVNALIIEMERLGMKTVHNHPIAVYYASQMIGEYFADLVIEDRVIVEVKAAKTLLQEHEAQLLNYLKATPFEVGLLLNFGPKPERIRRSFENTRKEWWVAQNKPLQSA